MVNKWADPGRRRIIRQRLERAKQERIMQEVCLLHKDVEKIYYGASKHGENLQVNNSRIEQLQEDVKNLLQHIPRDEYSGIDYYDFENYFRGSCEEIMKRQEKYLAYFAKCSNVVDIGCGRGEFLQLLKNKGITARGVDTYEKYVELCRQKGLDASLMDGIEFLKQQENLDGVFVCQVVEHLNINQIVELCNVAYEKMKEGAYLILETPNPRSLAIFANAFYMDPSHIKPINPLTLEYIVKKSGFEDVTIYYTEDSKYPLAIPKLEGELIHGLEQFNYAMNHLSEMLFGSQDYAIIAKK